jgi:hypothetical protein
VRVICDKVQRHDNKGNAYFVQGCAAEYRVRVCISHSYLLAAVAVSFRNSVTRKRKNSLYNIVGCNMTLHESPFGTLTAFASFQRDQPVNVT